MTEKTNIDVLETSDYAARVVFKYSNTCQHHVRIMVGGYSDQDGPIVFSDFSQVFSAADCREFAEKLNEVADEVDRRVAAKHGVKIVIGDSRVLELDAEQAQGLYDLVNNEALRTSSLSGDALEAAKRVSYTVFEALYEAGFRQQ